MTLTDNERIFLSSVISGSNFNGDYIDLNKTYEEQRFEDGERYYSIMDCQFFKRYLKDLNNAGIRAVFGSLVKKEMLSYCDDIDGFGRPMTWIIIGKDEFENIKAFVDQLK